MESDGRENDRPTTLPDDEERKPVGHRGWKAAGWVALTLAGIGLLLPLVPQVPFAIVAAFCFSKGSPRMHRKLLEHPQLGPPLRDWENGRIIRPRLKIISAATMIFGAALTYWKLNESHPKAALVLVGLFAVSIGYVVSRRSQPPATL